MAGEDLRIPARFNGPPGSGHGGWSAGSLAERLEASSAEVALRAPPPLDRDLAVVAGDGGVLRALDGDRVVLEARPAAVDVEPPDPVPVGAAAAATSPWGERHPFPTCFGCGPDRAPGDGLRLFAGPVAASGVFAARWVPDPAFGSPAPRRLVWAALDCPTAAPHIDPPPAGPLVLAVLAVDVRSAVEPGEPHVVGAWTTAIDGRKRRSAGALWDAEGRVLAVARALWIELRPVAGPAS